MQVQDLLSAGHISFPFRFPSPANCDNNKSLISSIITSATIQVNKSNTNATSQSYLLISVICAPTVVTSSPCLGVVETLIRNFTSFRSPKLHSPRRVRFPHTCLFAITHNQSYTHNQPAAGSPWPLANASFISLEVEEIHLHPANPSHIEVERYHPLHSSFVESLEIL